MDKNQGPLSWLKNLLNHEGKADKKTSKYQYLVIVLCLGVACMLAGNILFKSNPSVSAASTVKSQPSNSNDVPAFSPQNNSSDYEKQYEDELKTAIEGMLGVKGVTVVVNLDSSDQQIYATNQTTSTQTTEQTDKSGGHQKTEDSTTNEQLVTTNNGNDQVPVVTETKKPVIRGVLVLAKGAEDIHVKALIVEAVTRALGVPSFRVAVEPAK